MDEDRFSAERERMVELLRRQGIGDERVLRAISRVPRHLFVPEEYLPWAYADTPLPIGHGQTISQPYIVALSTEALGVEGWCRVLEVGTGSGYQTAILAELAGEVYTIERIEALSLEARRRLESLGYRNVHFRVGDGTMGWPEAAPFDRILITAGAPRIPKPLEGQLAEGGRMVAPIGDRTGQYLYLFVKERGRLRKKALCPCTFVPLIGREGWPEGAN